MAGIGGGIVSVLDKLVAGLDDVKKFVVDPVAQETYKLLHLGEKQAGVAANAVVDASAFLYHLETSRKHVAIHLDIGALTREYGAPVAKFAVDHPGDMATIAAFLAVFTDGTANIALSVLAMTAGSVQTGEDFKNRDYVGGTIDLASVVMAVGGVGGERLTAFAEEARVDQQADYRALVAKSISTPAPSLTPQQQRDFATIVTDLRSASSRAETLKSQSKRLELASAFASLTTSVRSHVAGK